MTDHKNIKHRVLLLRDIRNKEYTAEDETLMTAMKVASRNNLLIYLLDTESFPALNHVKETIVAFASRIDVVDMNNIPIKKTIDMMKMSDEDSQRVAKFVLNADLSLKISGMRVMMRSGLYSRRLMQKSLNHKKTQCSRPRL